MATTRKVLGQVAPSATTDTTLYSVQGWEWHPSDEAAYEAMAPEMLPVLAQQVAAQQALIDELLAALGGGGNG